MNKGLGLIVLLGVVLSIGVILLESSKQSRDFEYISVNDMNNVTLFLVGDIMLGRNVGEEPFKYVERTTQSADITVGNLEYAITESNMVAEKKINLKTTCGKSEKLKDAGFDYVSIANNHIMDFGEVGLTDTIQCLNQMSISYTGAGVNTSEAEQFNTIYIKNISIGFLSYTSISPKYAYATNNSSGVSNLRGDIEQNIVEAKKKVDYLIIYTHWGVEYTFEPSEYQKMRGHDMINSGADLVIGSHPHVMQSYEVYNGKYIFYSLGNFVFDQEHEVTKNSYALRIKLNKSAKIVSIEKINIRIDDSTPFIISNERLI